MITYKTEEDKGDREEEFAAQLQAKDSEIDRLKQEHQSDQQQQTQAKQQISEKDKLINEKTEQANAVETARDLERPRRHQQRNQHESRAKSVGAASEHYGAFQQKDVRIKELKSISKMWMNYVAAFEKEWNTSANRVAAIEKEWVNTSANREKAAQSEAVVR